jgi:hypothetical protein
VAQGGREAEVNGAAAHPEYSCGVGLAGGGQAAANRRRQSSGIYGEGADGGGDSGRPGLIPWTGVKREAQRSPWTARARSGGLVRWHRAVTVAVVMRARRGEE